MKVSSQFHPRKMAGAIAGLIQDHQHAEIQAIGAGSLKQAVKSMAIAKYYLQKDGLKIVFTISMVDVDIVDRRITGIRFTVKPASASPTSISPGLDDWIKMRGRASPASNLHATISCACVLDRISLALLSIQNIHAN